MKTFKLFQHLSSRSKKARNSGRNNVSRTSRVKAEERRDRTRPDEKEKSRIDLKRGLVVQPRSQGVREPSDPSDHQHWLP